MPNGLCLVPSLLLSPLLSSTYLLPSHPLDELSYGLPFLFRDSLTRLLCRPPFLSFLPSFSFSLSFLSLLPSFPPSFLSFVRSSN